MQMSLGHFVGQWLEILRKLSYQKLEYGKAPSCKIQGMSEWSERCLPHCCKLAFVVVVGDVREGLNYIVYHNPNYSNCEILRINALNYSPL